MALQPSSFQGRESLQPGARGETFQANLPGYRNGGDRINRTNNKLAVGPHDVPNAKYAFDYRLPVLFKYGFAYGYNQIVIPKGRAVALDPFMDLVDFEMKVPHNVLTLANGGVPVRLRVAGDKYKNDGTPGLVSTAAKGGDVHGVGKEWIPVAGMAQTYTDHAYRPFMKFTAAGANPETDPAKYTYTGAAAQMSTEGLSIDSATGKMVKSAAINDAYRAGNLPIGILQRNEYTRNDDAYNGIMPGPIMTDAMVELPWFAYKDKAEQNPWGSAYGGLFPGALLKSDENGRLVISPLSFESEMITMSLPEYEAERQQLIGQCFEASRTLLPEGAAIWATWALEDRMNFEDFNPAVFPQNNRPGEDAVSRSPYDSTGEYPGYPYDKAFKNSDLHMLASAGRMGNYDLRLNPQYQYANLGIPGLTDGKNAAVRTFGAQTVGAIHYAGGSQDYVDIYVRTWEVDVDAASVQISLGGAFSQVTEGALYAAGGQTDWLQCSYFDAKQGIIRLSVVNKSKADTALNAAAGKKIEISLKFDKRGVAGIPTHLDWDGAIGSVKVLLQK